MNITTEYVHVYRDRIAINLGLLLLAPDVLVVGSQMTEDGYELILEGNAHQIADFICAMGQGEGEGEGIYGSSASLIERSVQ